MPGTHSSQADTSTPEGRAEYIGQRLLPHDSPRGRDALARLFEADPDAGPIRVLMTYKRREPGSAARARELAEGATPQGFNPETEAVQSGSQVSVKQAYDGARAEGLDDAAEYLRGLPDRMKRPFARLLLVEYLEDPP